MLYVVITGKDQQKVYCTYDKRKALSKAYEESKGYEWTGVMHYEDLSEKDKKEYEIHCFGPFSKICIRKCESLDDEF